jgi:hypothetical protein
VRVAGLDQAARAETDPFAIAHPVAVVVAGRRGPVDAPPAGGPGERLEGGLVDIADPLANAAGEDLQGADLGIAAVVLVDGDRETESERRPFSERFTSRSI